VRGAIRSELLRAVSGSSILPVYLVALLMPAFVLFSDGRGLDVDGLDSASATLRLLEPLAWSGVSAAFVAAYSVTRECYYASMDRTLTGVGAPHTFAGKLIGGAIVAVALTAAIFALWTTSVSVLLVQDGLALELTSEAWRGYAGAMGSAILGAFIGGAVGWISRNYYVTAAIVLVLPMVVELALLRTAPEAAKFSPGLVLAALSIPGHQNTLLDFLPALCIGLVWTVGLVTAAWFREHRRRT